MLLRCVAIVTAASALQLTTAKIVAPNHFLGSCLTKDWVQTMEVSLGVNSTARDAIGRLENPFLHAALQQSIYAVQDPRTARAGVYKGDCPPDPKSSLYGGGATVDETTGAVLDAGVVNGSVVLELNGWPTHSLTTLVFSIVASEVYGFAVAHYYNEATEPMTQRMSSVGTGYCTPTHLNLEVWTAGTKPALLMYRNESYVAGDVGYEGRSGLYTTADFVRDAMDKTKQVPPLYADFWKGYRFDETLIRAVPESALRKNAAFFPPAGNKTYCKDGVLGCKDHCAKTLTCRDREASGGECMAIAMMVYYFDPGYLQAAVNNIGIPAYFCFLGFGGMQNYALDAYAKKRPVLFYHYEPDLFHIEHPEIFQRVFLPRAIPERVVTATGQFGGAYDTSTTAANPVDVDFPATKLAKYAAKVLQNQQDNPISQLVSKFSLSELHMNDLLRKYRDKSADKSVVDANFDAACAWVKENYNEWTKWLDRVPLCNLDAHVTYTLTGCDHENATDSRRTVTFAWTHPDPTNALVAANCDGGLRTLPVPIVTSRSCAWIRSDPSKWRSWVQDKPACDASFYKYNITGCDTQAKRTVQYWWLLVDPQHPSQSLECTGGEKLPSAVLVDCDYMPTDAPAFFGVLVVTLIIMALLAVSMLVVVRFRDRPIIRRSQYEFLLLVVFGGIIMCASALIYAGEPTVAICGARPATAAASFTIIFGSLFVKSLRVYRVFMKSAFKRATVSSLMMAKVLLGLVIVDVVIIGVWFAVDYPMPTITTTPAKEFRGDVDHIACTSKSFIFSALLIFWKSIVLFMGLYASFLVRNVSTDFQESIWMFASSMMVLVGCLVILPLAYLVDMPAAAFYIFLAGCLLVCTSLVMAFMLVPKFTRLQAESNSGASSASQYASNAASVKHSKRESGVTQIGNSHTQIRPTASRGTCNKSSETTQ